MLNHHLFRKFVILTTSMLLCILVQPEWSRAGTGSSLAAVSKTASNTAAPVSLCDEVRLPQGKRKTYTFSVASLPDGRDAVIVRQ